MIINGYQWHFGISYDVLRNEGLAECLRLDFRRGAISSLSLVPQRRPLKVDLLRHLLSAPFGAAEPFLPGVFFEFLSIGT